MVKFASSKSDVPVVWFTLGNGKGAYAVLDTGSESTMFDREFALTNKKEFKINVTENKVNLIGMSQSTKETIVELGTNVKLGEATVFVDGIATNLSNIADHFKKQYDEDIRLSAIFGSDTLTKFGAVIDLDNKELILDDLSRKQ